MNGFEVVPGKVFDVIGVDEAFVAKINEECLKMKINGIEDKAGYEKVKQAKMVYVHTRVKVEKHGKELRGKVKVYTDAVMTEEKRLIALLTPGEEHLAAEQKAIDDQLKAIKEAEARKEQERIRGRIDRLSAFGMGLFGVDYRLPYPGPTIPQSMISIMNDNDFDVFCLSVFNSVAAEKDRLDTEAKRNVEEAAEKERLAKEDADRITKEKESQEAERLRLEALAKELNDKVAALKAEQDRIDAEKKRVADEEAARLAEIERAKQKAIDDEARAAELEKAKEAAKEQARIEVEAKIKRQVEEKAAQDLKDKIEAERKEALRPDKERLLAFAGNDFFVPNMSTDQGKAIIAEFKAGLTIIVNQLKERAGAL